ncbi:hypothetical protein X944_4019 [Burkholderia pseudomallei MSHR3964]|nr:hypothetical protein X944_4019 [Burkholderia pseudomallei MSHR3964]
MAQLTLLDERGARGGAAGAAAHAAGGADRRAGAAASTRGRRAARARAQAGQPFRGGVRGRWRRTMRNLIERCEARGAPSGCETTNGRTKGASGPMRPAPRARRPRLRRTDASVSEARRCGGMRLANGGAMRLVNAARIERSGRGRRGRSRRHSAPSCDGAAASAPARSRSRQRGAAARRSGARIMRVRVDAALGSAARRGEPGVMRLAWYARHERAATSGNRGGAVGPTRAIADATPKPPRPIGRALARPSGPRRRPRLRP